VSTEDTADMTMALILAVPRRGGGSMLTSDKDWTGWSPTWMWCRIWGKRQHHRHGAHRAAVAHGHLSAFRSTIIIGDGSRPRSRARRHLLGGLDQMLARMDIVSVNCPHTPATYHLLSARRLKMLRPEAYIVNTARGEVIDENELARLVEAGAIAGAGLDVFEHEPAINPKLLASDRVVALPHMGSATIEGRIDMGEKVIINIKTFLDGHTPPDRVHPAMF
jgi:glyoxylate reductase